MKLFSMLIIVKILRTAGVFVIKCVLGFFSGLYAKGISYLVWQIKNKANFPYPVIAWYRLVRLLTKTREKRVLKRAANVHKH